MLEQILFSHDQIFQEVFSRHKKPLCVHQQVIQPQCIKRVNLMSIQV